jgi:hypothetical protein
MRLRSCQPIQLVSSLSRRKGEPAEHRRVGVEAIEPKGEAERVLL